MTTSTCKGEKLMAVGKEAGISFDKQSNLEEDQQLIGNKCFLTMFE